MAESIKQKAVSGVFWNSLEKFLHVGVQFASGIILARLLTPADYGAIGMLTIFISVSAVFLDGGFGTALVQKKKPTQEDYSTVFWWELAMSLLVVGALCLISGPVARFYNMPVLRPVLCVMSLQFILGALSNTPGNQIVKKMLFKKRSIANIVVYLFSLAVTIVLAYCGWGVWALVVQTILTSLLTLVANLVINPWMPSFIFSKESFKSLFSFGIFVAFSHVINEIGNNIQGLLIGRFFDASTMGFYSKGKGLERVVVSTFTQSLKNVTFPYYAEYQDDKPHLANVIKRLTSAMSYFLYPLLFILILIARPLIILLYSNRWIESIPYFQILCLAGLAICLQNINAQAITAIGKSRIMFRWTLIKRTFGLSLLLVGFFLFGIKGMLWGMVISSWTILLINMGLVSYYIGYRFVQQLFELLRILLLASLAFAIAFMSTNYLNFNMYVAAVIETTIYIVVYLGVSRVLKMNAYLDFMGVAKPYFDKILKKIKK